MMDTRETLERHLAQLLAPDPAPMRLIRVTDAICYLLMLELGRQPETVQLESSDCHD